MCVYHVSVIRLWEGGGRMFRFVHVSLRIFLIRSITFSGFLDCASKISSIFRLLGAEFYSKFEHFLQILNVFHNFEHILAEFCAFSRFVVPIFLPKCVAYVAYLRMSVWAYVKRHS